jgi:hypothetical protein
MENPPLSEAVKAAATATVSSGDTAKLRALSDEITGLRRSNLEFTLKLLDKIFRANENGGLFYEKLILFDVGTIGLSLTLLAQIVAHSPGAHVPRYPFLWFLCPAWFLLLVSIQCSAQQIVSFHNANTLLTKQITAVSAENYIRDVTVLVGRIPAVVGEISLTQTEPQTVGEFLKKSGEALVNTANENTGKANELIQRAFETNKKLSIAARIGIIATTLALLLICVFAVQSILGM